jgi:hypothetical protein
MFRKYDDLVCLNNLDENNEPKKIGLDGWYAMGQAWSYFHGKLKLPLLGAVAQISSAVVLQMQAPNPTFGHAAFNLSYGDDKSWSGTAEFGSRCEFDNLDSDDEFGLDLVVSFTPAEKSTNVGIEENVFVDFLFPLAESVPQYPFLNGDPGELTFQLDMDSTGLYNKNGLIDVEIVEGNSLYSLTFIPNDFLNSNDSVWAVVKINILRDGDLYETQSKTISFKTSNGLQIIPKSNIAYEYTIDGMTNFHLEQISTTSVYQQGYIRLNKGQANIFFDQEYDDEGNRIEREIKARFTSDSGEVTLQDLTYDPFKYDIQFKMPSAEFTLDTRYKLEIVSINVDDISNGGAELKTEDSNGSSSYDPDETIYYTSYFRTSQYKTVTEKFLALSSSSKIKDDTKKESTARGPSDNYHIIYFNLNEGEVFDSYDFGTDGNYKPLVEFSAYKSLNFPETIIDKSSMFSYYSGIGFWPFATKFKVIYDPYIDEGFIYKESQNIISNYKITADNFNSSFNTKIGELNYGFLSDLGNLGSLKVNNNIPGGDYRIVYGSLNKSNIELSQNDFFDTGHDIGTPEQLSSQGGYDGDVTWKIVSLITGVLPF